MVDLWLEEKEARLRERGQERGAQLRIGLRSSRGEARSPWIGPFRVPAGWKTGLIVRTHDREYQDPRS